MMPHATTHDPRRFRRCSIAPLASLTLGLLLLVGCTSEEADDEPGSTAVVSILASEAPDGFLRIDEARPLRFPPDHGPHPETQIEWWYTTGNVRTGAGRRFGFEVTFFRIGLDPEADPGARASEWATRDLHMAHFAITDVDGDRFHAFDRFTRGALGLAGAEGDPWRVWNETWRLEARDGSEAPFPIELVAADLEDGTPIALDLTLTGVTPMVLQGDRGFSRKGPEPGNASLYYTYPRLAVTGTITAADGPHPVEGTAWFDHEWSTSVLSDELAGWDWFALQLDGERALMAYGLRRGDGSFSPESAATWIAADGTVRKFSASEFSIEVIDRWRSPHTTIEYPALWRIEVPALELDLTVTPVRSDQELRLATVYWEGAVDTAGTIDGAPAAGVGYVELVGYGESEATAEE